MRDKQRHCRVLSYPTIRFFCLLSALLAACGRDDLKFPTEYQAVFLDNGQVFFGRLQDDDGITENGAGALDLTVGPQNAQSLQTGVGGKIAVPLPRNSVTVTPQAYAFYQHEYSDSSRTLDARLSQVGIPFTYDFTGAQARNFAVVGADVTIATKKNLKVQLDYNAEVGRGNYMAHYVRAGLRWEF